jgi:hypothetical protein
MIENIVAAQARDNFALAFTGIMIEIVAIIIAGLNNALILAVV